MYEDGFPISCARHLKDSRWNIHSIDIREGMNEYTRRKDMNKDLWWTGYISMYKQQPVLWLLQKCFIDMIVYL
jgi:hypothetical protein